MDFKILIKCEKCKCSFELRPVDFSDRENLSCPNCGQELEQSAFVHLKTGLVELSKVPDVIPEEANAFSLAPEEKPQFSLSVKEYNIYIEHFGRDKS